MSNPSPVHFVNCTVHLALHVHQHWPVDLVEQRLASILNLLGENQETNMATMAELKERMEKMATVGEALRVQYASIKAQLEQRGVDQQILDEVFAMVGNEADADGALIVANTPNENPTPDAGAGDQPQTGDQQA